MGEGSWSCFAGKATLWVGAVVAGGWRLEVGKHRSSEAVKQ
jgi:hypothetical protein